MQEEGAEGWGFSFSAVVLFRAFESGRKVEGSKEKSRRGLARSFGLRGVGDRGVDEAIGANAVEDGIRSAAEEEFADSWFRTNAAEIGMNSQSFNDGNDASS